MRIILVNYRYFFAGGPERYLFNVKALLERYGHEVIPFSVKHNMNMESPYENYFASPIGNGDVTYFSEINKTSFNEIRKFFTRMFYSFEVRKKFKKLLKDTNPDIVYVLHYLNKLSPSFIGVAKKHNIPVVQRISDFGHICANQLFYNYKTSSVCELCLKGSKWNAVRFSCVYDSRLYSLIKIMALKTHEILGITKKINAFVVPSQFTISKLQAFGIPESKLHHVPSFYKTVDQECSQIQFKYDDYALYVGRLEEEKGIMTLVRAFEGTNMKLKIIGYSSKNYDLKIKEFLSGKSHNIEFLGKMPFEEVKRYLSECAFTICPSECYDNFPNSVLESFAFQKAVVCTDLGSLREMVNNGVTGMLYKPGNYIQLREYCQYLFANINKCKRMGRTGRNWVGKELSENRHYNELHTIFKKCLSIPENKFV